MEGGALFNPGFLGGSFLWWVGQIVDDSAWRDNINSGKYEDRTGIPGWGRRYKVRIIGLHDQGEESIPSDQLPWAQVMYPVTAGGGQAGASDSTKLRQGNMVFGFFIDGQEQQVPVIMGVLGNNSQTVLAQKNSTVADTVTDSQPGVLAKSGYSEGTTPKSGTAREVPPDPDLSLIKPEEGPPSNENADGIQQTTVADSRRQAKCEEKIALAKPQPDEFINSVLKGIQTTIENLTNKLDAILQTIQSYADAITNKITNIQDSIDDAIRGATRQLTKFMKPIFDKIQEYALKILNKGFNMIIAALPSSLRYQFKDMVQVITELMLCMYNKMTGKLAGQISGSLKKALDIDNILKEAVADNQSGSGDSFGFPSNPKVPMCAAESLVASVIAINKDEITESNNAIVDNLNSYLEDVSETLAGITGFASEITNTINDVIGSMTGALDFTNFSINVFGCELKPTPAESDIYTFCSGGDQTPPPAKPSSNSVEEGVNNASDVVEDETTPYLEPDRTQSDLDLTEDDAARIIAEERAIADIPADQNPDPRSNTVVRDDIDTELERARAGDRSGLDDALDIQ
jgi:hypothetical protein